MGWEYRSYSLSRVLTGEGWGEGRALSDIEGKPRSALTLALSRITGRGNQTANQGLPYNHCSMDPAPSLLICVKDLLFGSKVTATARAHSVAFRGVRGFSRLIETPAEFLIIDLNHPGSVEAAAQWKAKFNGHVTGFVSHVAEDVIAQARAAGIDQVMSNGAFTARLDDIVRNIAAKPA
jgi:hypothetical protein